MILAPDHQTPRHHAQGGFERVHMDVDIEHLYTFALQQSGGERDDRRVGCAQKFLHAAILESLRALSRQDKLKPMDTTISGRAPHDQLAEFLHSDLVAVNGLIRARMASENAPRIPEVTAHLIEAGGKRIRPMLVLASAHLCGYSGPYHHHLAATVEFIHTATLLHDDVVDESKQRRGRATANLLWDNKSSVLVGDYLFARAFQLMVECGSLRVLDILSNASATIAEGEVLQLTTAQNTDTSEEQYLRVIRGKTAALFSAATEAGAVIAGAPEDHVRALFEYGDALGIAFQIVDDFLDWGGAGAQIGKNIGDDFREGKVTLPLIRALAAADMAERAFWTRTIAQGKQEAGDLEQAMAILARHNALDQTREEALDWAARAKAALSPLPDHPLRAMLSALADYVVARVN